MVRVNELIVTPLTTLVFLFLSSLDFISLITATVSTIRVWSEWIEYSHLRFVMQRMYLTTMATGGPQIVTNDPDYLPYVYADAVVRVGTLHPGSGKVRRSPELWTHSQSSLSVPVRPPQ
jgi:hypothetical protein